MPENSPKVNDSIQSVQRFYQGNTCREIEDELQNATHLQLRALNLQDIRVLAGLKKIISIDLQDNNIDDLWALASMEKLTEFKISGNPIDKKDFEKNEINCPGSVSTPIVDGLGVILNVAPETVRQYCRVGPLG